MTGRGDGRRLASLCLLAFLPWTATIYPGGTGLVFPWGLLSTSPTFGLVPITEYYFTHTYAQGLPPHLLAWGVGTLVYAFAVVSAAIGTTTGREDRRVTAALLLVAAVAHLRFTVGTDHGGITSVPVGPAALLLVAWWFHAGDLRRITAP
ncbi:TIGR04206 family protein [Halostella sp. JP-L12]|uniref:TIGR04206 family protein n=1 Tax=Halostella TaxID=1843185 RepID=UPI000EF7A24E|nr:MULTISPECIES: TIGR04206 family protein [Halostella]NHN48735.1 TIGR04206 family protein [Halostella sp. JP-L12]